MIPFFAVLIAALVCAGPAHAGFLVPVVAGLFGGGAIATAAASILVGVGSSLVSRALQPKQKAQGPGAISIDAPTSGDGTPQSIILGGRAVAGHRTCPEYSRGNGKEWLTIIRDLSDMPINGLVSVWVGNDRLAVQGTQGAGGDVLVPRTTGADSGWFTPSGGKYAGKLRVRFYNGTQTAADPHLLAEYGSHPDRPWQADMRLLGVAYVILELKRDQQLFPGIPDLLFEVEGAKLYDPRNGQMVWSNNLALIAYNVMRGIQMPDGSIYGGGLDDADLPLSSWAPAINEAGAQNWRGGLEISVGPQDYDGDLPYEVVEHLLQGCAGQVAESGGVWRVRIGGPGLPVASATDRDVVISENQVFMPHLGPREVYNGVTGQYSETAERWESKTTPLRINPAYVARDGARNVVHLTYHAVTDSQQCQKLIQMALDDNRRQRILELTLPLDYAPVEVLDTLSLSLPYDGYVGKLVEITAKTTDPVTMGQRVFVREVDPNDYTPPTVAPLPTAPVVTTPALPQPLPGWAVEPVIVQDAEGRNRRPGVRIMWTPLPAEGIEWELRSQGATALAGEGTTQEVEKGQRVITAGLINGTAMQIRGRAVLRNRARAWTAWTDFIAPDVGLDWVDFDQQLREDIQADLALIPLAQEAAADARVRADAVRDDLDAAVLDAQGDIVQVRGEIEAARAGLSADIAAAESLANSNLNVAKAYTDTGLLSESVARQAGDQALAAQIQTLTAALTSDNLLDNSLFASGLDGWTVSGFITVQERDTGSSDPIFANAPTANFVRIIPPASGTRMMRQDFPVEFGTNEVFQWRVKATSAASGRTLTIRVNWFNASDAQIGGNVDTVLTLVQNEWRIFSAQHTPPTGAVSMRWQVLAPASGSEPSYIADPAVTRVDQSTIARITALEVVFANQDEAFALFRDTAEARLDSNEAAITTEGATRAAADSALASQISTVSAVADGRNRTFRQGTAPTGAVAGDIWYDTANGNLPKRWSGTAWVNTDDVRIGQNAAAITTEQTARADADTALAGQIATVSAVANSRNRTFRQGTAPTGAVTGDIWFDTSDNNRPMRWSGSAWVDTDDTRIAANSAAITAEQLARADADTALATQINAVSAVANARNRTFRQGTAPTGPVAGDVWYDTSANNRLRRWNGTGWQDTDDTRIAANAAAITAEQIARADGDGALATQINTVSAVANARNRTFRQGTAPSNPVTGDIWYNSANGNIAQRWSGTAWVAVDDTRITSLTASVTTQATAISTLQNGAQAGYLVRAQAGNSVSLLDLIAADGSGQTPTSIARLSADQILLEGSVFADQLAVVGVPTLVHDPLYKRLGSWVGLLNSTLALEPAASAGGGVAAWGGETILRILPTAANGYSRLISRKVRCAPGQRIKVEVPAWVNAAGRTAVARVFFYATEAQAGTAPTNVAASNAVGTTRGVARIETEVPAGCAWMALELASPTGTSTAQAWFGYPELRIMDAANLIVSGGVVADMVTAETMRALNGRFSSLAAANVTVGNGEVGTLKIAGNAVTVPVYRQFAQNINAGQSWTTIRTENFTVSDALFANVIVNVIVDTNGTSPGIKRWGYRLLINGTVRDFIDGLAFHDNMTLTGGLQVSSGNVQVQLQIESGSLVVAHRKTSFLFIGAKR